MKKEINVLVTGAAGQIGYALLPRLASGETFGGDTIVNLRLVEIPQVVEKLKGTIMDEKILVKVIYRDGLSKC